MSIVNVKEGLLDTTLKMTPAMAAGLTDHPWTMEELVTAPEGSLTCPDEMRIMPSPTLHCGVEQSGSSSGS